jgi:hypothetical protein
MLLKELYVDSALKKADKIDPNTNEKEEYREPSRDISFKNWSKENKIVYN